MPSLHLLSTICTTSTLGRAHHWTTGPLWTRSIHPSDHPRCPGNSLLGRVLRILQRANMHSVKLNNLKYKLGNFTKEDDFSGNVRPFGVSVHFVACVYWFPFFTFFTSFSKKVSWERIVSGSKNCATENNSSFNLAEAGFQIKWAVYDKQVWAVSKHNNTARSAKFKTPKRIISFSQVSELFWDQAVWCDTNNQTLWGKIIIILFSLQSMATKQNR